MEMKKVFWASLALFLISAMVSMASMETIVESAHSNTISNDIVTRGSDGLTYYNKSPLSRIFLPKGNVADGDCLPSGGFCMFSPMDCCGNCGCLYPVGVCYGTGC
ncbi:hypothetical protein POM88_024216 [Heracleum sosnowskyi]|uniref:DUF5637 domain-containing protein n=1 Tax=Heracleum sosnowskyi TaxID=360622 RepID=A0AAD8I3P1_9APIA|nr:hypothetical protein POM88_024216 [Heracleum sosnowskyi]